MSVTLTNRDAATLALSTASISAKGVLLIADSATPQDATTLLVRSEGIGTNKPRANRQLIRRKVDSAGRVSYIKTDITTEVLNPESFSADDIGDHETFAASYIATDAEALAQLSGFVKQ